MKPETLDAHELDIEQQFGAAEQAARTTPKPQAGTWTLTAPDGRTWTGSTPLQACSAEQRVRVPAEVALQRILAATRADGTDVLSEIVAEVGRAMRKFPTWPTDPLHALAVLGEEFGELTKDVLQLTYEPHKTNRDNVRTEAMQTAAMALRFVASLDAYEYTAGTQHAQENTSIAGADREREKC
jgi:hypothetical protein